MLSTPDKAPSREDVSRAETLISAASSKSWRERYDALQGASHLPWTLQRQVAEAFVKDENKWVSALASYLLMRRTFGAFRTGQVATTDIDAITRGTKLSSAQRSALVELFEAAQQTGSADYLALTADRAARLVTDALSADGKAARSLLALQRFLRHVGYYARPRIVIASREPTSNVIESIRRQFDWPLEITGDASYEIDAGPARIILEELVVNAIEAEATKLTIDVGTGDGNLLLRCRNDGEPLDEVAAPFIFDPWYTTRTGHAGLGLWIAMDQADRAGGRLYLQSVAPVAFEVFLPLVS